MGSTLILADIENFLCGGNRVPAKLKLHHVQDLAQKAGLSTGDHFIAAGNPRAMKLTRRALRSFDNVTTIVVPREPDAADKALVTKGTPSIGVYDKLVVMSGDHFFVGIMQMAHELGVRVHLVRPSTCSPKLLRHADKVIRPTRISRLQPSSLQHELRDAA